MSELGFASEALLADETLGIHEQVCLFRNHVVTIGRFSGVQIKGVDMSQSFDDPVIGSIRSAFDEWKVVFSSDQQLYCQHQIAFGRHFGELTEAHPHDDAPTEGCPEIDTVDPRARIVLGPPVNDSSLALAAEDLRFSDIGLIG